MTAPDRIWVAPNRVYVDPWIVVEVAHQGDAGAVEYIRADLVATPAPAAMTEVPTEAQVRSACLSYRHDFGLLDTQEQERVMFQAREWLHAWRKELSAALRAGGEG